MREQNSIGEKEKRECMRKRGQERIILWSRAYGVGKEKSDFDFRDYWMSFFFLIFVYLYFLDVPCNFCWLYEINPIDISNEAIIPVCCYLCARPLRQEMGIFHRSDGSVEQMMQYNWICITIICLCPGHM